jgi:hypothetical protein
MSTKLRLGRCRLSRVGNRAWALSQYVPLTGIGLVGVGVVWGVHDVTAGTLHWVLPTASSNERTWSLTSAQYSAIAASVGSVVFVREVLLPPPVYKLAELRWEGASTFEWLRLGWRSVERTVRYFPYRYRLMTVVMCGLASGTASVATEYSMLSSMAKTAAEQERKQREDYAAAAAVASNSVASADASKDGSGADGPAQKSISRTLGTWALSAASTVGGGIGAGASAVAKRIGSGGAQATSTGPKPVCGESSKPEAEDVFGSFETEPDEGPKPWDMPGSDVGTIRTALDAESRH